jgi:mannose/cellobiose epimerase-like protein (N-acyl-D-glucosamine 2-epimerase family)
MDGWRIEGAPWAGRPWHRRALARGAERLWAAFGANAIDPAGGFHDIGLDLAPLPAQAPRPLHATTRMIHAHAIAHMLGRPGSADMVDHGMAALARHHRDARHGGWHWSFDADGPADAAKRAYGHAFVLLAASSAAMAGHPDGAALLAEASALHEDRFWDAQAGMGREDFAPDWSDPEPYRGQNSNMHLTEALMGCFEATGERLYLDRATAIAGRLIDGHARRAGWVVPEHFDEGWTPVPGYEGDPMFRPAGTTPGHAVEWARLLVQLHALSGGAGWMPEAARGLFLTACDGGWHPAGGFVYTLGEDGAPARPERLWWPLAEGIAAAAVLRAATGENAGEDAFEAWYRRLWGVAMRDAVDPATGAWRPELDAPGPGIFAGLPDIYHALGACLTPLAPHGQTLAGAARAGRIALA